MNNLVEIIQSYLTGDPIVDASLIIVLFIMFNAFYTTLFKATFSIFKIK